MCGRKDFNGESSAKGQQKSRDMWIYWEVKTTLSIVASLKHSTNSPFASSVTTQEGHSSSKPEVYCNTMETEYAFLKSLRSITFSLGGSTASSSLATCLPHAHPNGSTTYMLSEMTRKLGLWLYQGLNNTYGSSSMSSKKGGGSTCHYWWMEVRKVSKLRNKRMWYSPKEAKKVMKKKRVWLTRDLSLPPLWINVKSFQWSQKAAKIWRKTHVLQYD